MDTSKFATKEDIKGVKSDIKEVKEDITGVKLDIKGVKKDISVVKTDIKNVKSDLRILRGETLKVEERVENVEDGIKEIKVMLGKMANTLDGFVGRVDDLTVENEVGTHQIRKLQLAGGELDKRLKHLESPKQTA